MKNLIIPYCLMVVLLMSCEDTEVIHTCQVDNPVQELEWLRLKTDSIAQDTTEFSRSTFISQARYEGNTVFLEYICCPLCNTVVPVFNCSGDSMGVLGSREGDIHPEGLSDEKQIWAPDDYTCID